MVVVKNILSYKPCTIFSGQEILDWAKYQIENKTSHFKQGKRVMRLYGKTLNPNRNYQIFSQYETWHCGNLVHKPLVVKEGKTILSYWEL